LFHLLGPTKRFGSTANDSQNQRLITERLFNKFLESKSKNAISMPDSKYSWYLARYSAEYQTTVSKILILEGIGVGIIRL
jgi:hypothetical protein